MFGKSRQRGAASGGETAPSGMSRTWFASAAVIGLVVVALVVVLIVIATRGGSGSSPGPVAAPPGPVAPGGGAPFNGGAGPGQTGAADPTRPPGCHTSGTDQTVPTGTPAGVTWTLARGVAVPSSASDGPTLRGDAGVGYCYADTPLGALLAASNLGQGTGTETAIQQADLEHSVVPNEYSTQAAAQSNSDPAPSGVQLAGFRVISYSPSQASVALAYAVATQPSTYPQLTLALQWYQGDWRAVPQPGPSVAVTSSTATTLAGFVPWSGVA